MVAARKRKVETDETNERMLKAGWTEAEDALVQMAVGALGTQWQAVADRLPGRT